jgi:hypothetical protein
MSKLNRNARTWRAASTTAIVLLGALWLAGTAAAAVPTVVTGNAKEITRTSMTICGTVDPNGETTTYHFAYEYYEAGWQSGSTPVESAGGGDTAVEECAHIAGLPREKGISYRLVATDASGEESGGEKYTVTAGAVEGLKTEAPSNIKRLGATSEVTFNGSLEPNGYDTHYYFEYGTPNLYQYTPEILPALPGADAGEADGAQHVAITIHIPTNTPYVYRLVGVNQLGISTGVEQSVLAPAVEGVTTLAPTGVTTTGAVLRGQFEPNGYDTHWQFKCQSEVYTASRPVFFVPSVPVDAGTASGPVAVEATVSELGAGKSLAGNTPVQCELVASNSLGADEGAPVSFRTAGAAPTPEGVEASSVTKTTAALLANLLTQNEATSYWVEYVPSEDYEPSAVNPYADGAVSSEAITENDPYVTPALIRGIANLTASTTYHYRFVAENGSGKTYGVDHTFTTAGLTPPIVSTGAASGVTTTSVTLAGMVDPAGLQTSYEFQLGETAEYGGAQIFGNAGGGAGEEAVATTLSYLVPGVTYHYRVVATSVDGTTYGADRTFTTPAVPSPISQLTASPLIAFTPVAFPKDSEASTVKPGKKAKQKAKHPAKKTKKRRKSKSKKKK